MSFTAVAGKHISSIKNEEVKLFIKNFTTSKETKAITLAIIIKSIIRVEPIFFYFKFEAYISNRCRNAIP